MSEEIIDNVSDDTSPKRDQKGRFVGSGNLRGRPRGTKGKQKHSKVTLENMLFKFGPDALKKIMTMANEALAKGDATTAFKCLVFISGKYYELVVHNEKISIQEKQLKEKESNEEEESSNGYTTVEFTPFKIA